MEDIAQFWEQLLYTTGGVLASLEKCFFVALDWKFYNDEYSLMSKDERNVEINLTSGNDYTALTKIPPKDAKDGPHNLGAMLSPEGNNQDEYKKKIQRHEVLFAYQTMLQPAMK